MGLAKPALVFDVLFVAVFVGVFRFCGYAVFGVCESIILFWLCGMRISRTSCPDGIEAITYKL